MLDPLDEQLRALVRWRNTRLEELVQALIDVDVAQQRLDCLLDRKLVSSRGSTVPGR